MNIYQLAALIMILGYTRKVGSEINWIGFCYNATLPTINGSSGNGNAHGIGTGNSGNGIGNDGNGNGSGNGNTGNGNNGNNTKNSGNATFYMNTICNARIASFVASCTGTHSTFTLESAVPNSGQLVLDKTSVTNLDCTHLCEFLLECVFFTYEPNGSQCQIYIVGDDTPSAPVVWRKLVL